MSSSWFGQSFRSALYFTSAGSHIAVYDGNLNQKYSRNGYSQSGHTALKIRLRDLFVQEH